MPIPQLKNSSSESWRNINKNQIKKSAKTPRRDSFSSLKTSLNDRSRKTVSLKTLSNKNSSGRTSGNWQKNNTNNWKKILLKKIIIACLILGGLGFITLSIFVLIISRNLPKPDQLIEREVAQSTKIYDRSGEHVLYEISGDEKRTLINIEEIPDYAKKAIIAIEDKNFYNHRGFSFFAMFRTAITNIIYNRSAGGSTLTQQFVKNAVLTNEKTIIRKVKELIISYRLEKKFSKDEILQMYLNEIPYGSNAYGIEAASQKYFGKSVREVSLAEAAVLAAIVQVPSRYSPYGPNKDILLGRKDYVLKLMTEQGYISTEERDLAQSEEIVFSGKETNITAPHFVLHIKDVLAEKYGEKTIEQGGLKIYTTLDVYKQKIAEEVIKEKLDSYGDRYNANNASLVSIDPKTGQVLVMVGSRDYFNDEIDGQVNVSTRLRQPGSSMKPLVYAALFEKGYTPDTILYDVTTNFSNNPSDPYEPRNYNLQESGPVSIRKALAGSLNIPAVKALYLAGVNETINLLENFGYSSFKDRDRFGLAFVLGGAEVKLLEHVNAYSAFARDGEIREISMILKVEDRDGKILEEYEEKKKTVLSSQSARMMNEILSDNSARAYVFGENSFLNLAGRPSGVKTGTTNNFRDAWTVGYTPSIVTGVWVGNSNNKEMNTKADGSVVAAPIWNEYMKRILNDTPVEDFKKPDDYKTGIDILDGLLPVRKIMIDKLSGLPADEYSDPSLIEEKVISVHHSILFYVNKDKPLDKDKNSQDDPQFKLWESAVNNWWKKTSSSSDSIVLENDPEFGISENIPELKINSPKEGNSVTKDYLPVNISTEAKKGIKTVSYLINGNLVSLETKNFSDKTLSVGNIPNGFNTLTVKACDPHGNCSEEKVNFNLNINNNQINNQKNYINILSPNSGLAISDIDTPLSFQLEIKEPERVFRISIISKNESGELKYLKTINSNIEKITNFSIDNFYNGVNIIYPELRDYNGDVINGSEIIIVKN